MSSRMPDTRRASGASQVEEVTKAESDKNDEAEAAGEEVAGATESPRSKFRAVGFSRMKLDWEGEDRQAMSRASRAVDDRIQQNFRDAFKLMHDLFMVVREPVVNPDTGEMVKDHYGWPEWKRTVSGDFVEDWTNLSRKERENFIFTITTRIFAWEQARADAWGEAMFAKAAWEERFAAAYTSPRTGTIDDRTNAARSSSIDERYFGIFMTLYSRKADAIVSTMQLLGQRLKDTLEAS